MKFTTVWVVVFLVYLSKVELLRVGEGMTGEWVGEGKGGGGRMMRTLLR